MISRRELFRRSGGAALGALVTTLTPALATAAGRAAASVLPEVHFLRRIGWGLRVGEVEALARVGWPAYLEAQLSYETLPDPAVR